MFLYPGMTQYLGISWSYVGKKGRRRRHHDYSFEQLWESGRVRCHL